MQELNFLNKTFWFLEIIADLVQVMSDCPDSDR